MMGGGSDHTSTTEAAVDHHPRPRFFPHPQPPPSLPVDAGWIRHRAL